MKRLLITAGLVFSAFFAQAQITIGLGNHPITINGTDSLQAAKTTSVTWPDSGANKTWDYGSMADTSIISAYYYSKAVSSNFSAASRYHLQTTYLNSIPIYKYQYDANTSSGYSIVGAEFPLRLAYNISSITGGSNDSLVFPVQHQLFSTAMNILPYPLTYHTMWNSSTRADDHYLLTAAAFSMNNTPGEHVTHTIFNSKVVGWGKMRVPFSKGGGATPSAYYDVLMVQRQEMDIDSFYLNGSPAPSTLLSAFGLKNADTVIYNNILFYRPYTGLPLAEFNVAPNGQRYAYYDRNNTSLTAIDENVQGIAEGVMLYPNPVSAAATLSFTKTSAAPLKLTITNAMGEVIRVQNINAPAGTTQVQIELPASLGDGIYFYSLSGNGASANGKILVNR